MARRLYSLLFYLITPLIMLRLWLRARKAPAYGQRIAERFGFFEQRPAAGGIWLHSVSVGETIAAAPLVKQLQQRYPDLAITVTTMTPTGSERVDALFGDRVFHVYAPYDLPDALARFLNKIQPSMMIIMETELWPNTVYACQQRGIPVVLANARLSAKSARGYQRFAPLTQPMLQGLSCVAAQHQQDAERFLALGVPADNVQVTGSIKFDIGVDDRLRQQACELKNRWGQQAKRPIIVAASTHAGEEEMLLTAFRAVSQRCPQLLLILVPRHPERFNTVTQLCEGLNYRRRSEGLEPEDNTQVYIADTMGEMMLLLGCADIAVVGGSLIDRGGHNMLEPAAWGLPIITGLSDFNFLAISELLQQRGGLVKVADQTQLNQQLQQWLDYPDQQAAAGQAALAVIEQNRGALDRLLAVIADYHPVIPQ